MKIARFFIVFLFTMLASPVFGQARQSFSNENLGGQESAKEDTASGIALPSSEKFRIRVRVMASYGKDEANSTHGFEQQGRIGYAIVNLFGRIDNQFSYHLEISPINEAQPLPACGEKGFFYPNLPQNFGPQVVCDRNGRVRVDDYNFVGLDPVLQQGPIRQAYLQYQKGRGGIRFGRFLLPIGFDWEEAGSLTAKDATHIQRINAEANFGTMLSWGGEKASIDAAAFVGDGNRFHDYAYIYALDSSLDSNSALTGLVSARVKPVKGLELRAAYKQGYTGSKLESLPNYFAAKHNDYAKVLSFRYRPFQYGSVFGEYANYTWGLARTSAEMIGLTDGQPIRKDGYYVGGEITVPVTKNFKVGTVITQEELSRDDALIKLLAAQGQYQVEMGKIERSTAVRLFFDLGRHVRVGYYRHLHSNPYPWVSGIMPVEGYNAFTGKGSDKWGGVVRFTID